MILVRVCIDMSFPSKRERECGKGMEEKRKYVEEKVVLENSVPIFFYLGMSRLDTRL